MARGRRLYIAEFSECLSTHPTGTAEAIFLAIRAYEISGDRQCFEVPSFLSRACDCCPQSYSLRARS